MPTDNPQPDVWIELIKTVTTVSGTIVCAWLGNRIWKKRKENALIHSTETPALDTTDTVLLSARILAVEKIIEELAEDLDTRRQVLIAVLNAMELACWESDADGKCVFASDKLALIVGLNKVDCLNDGWVTNLLESDKDRVFREWENAVRQKRMFIMKYAFLHANDTVVNVRAVASPILVKNKLQGFIGVLEEVK